MIFPDGDRACKDTVLREVSGVNLVTKYVSNFSCCIQAGGNCGVYPIELSKHFAKVYTFEPDKVNYECLIKNQADNPIAQEIVCAYQAALSDKEGTSGLHRFEENIGAHYLEGAGDIKVITIDSLNLNPGLIWLDIEGAEWLALKGAIETIKRSHPVIVIECKKHGRRFGYENYEMFEWLTLLGYFKEAQVFNDQLWTFAS